MHTSENGIAFIESNEGFAAQVYNDNGNPAIGFGHDLLPWESFPNGLTRPQAEALLISDLRTRFESPVNALIPPTCTQNQFDACVDFCFNEGPRAFAIMMHHGWDQVPEQMLAWVWEHVKGVLVKSPGLQARREAEVQMFNS